MTRPTRIQRKRTKGARHGGAVYVGRGSAWGNPNRIIREPSTGGWHVVNDNSGSGVGVFADKDEAQKFAIAAYRAHLKAKPELAELVREHLAGRDLMCWCRRDEPCHADVLLAVANPEVVFTADDWNGRYEVGTRVIAYPDLRPEHPAYSADTQLEAVTRTPAWTLGHGEPVVSVEGYAGGISLSHVDVVADGGDA